MKRRQVTATYLPISRRTAERKKEECIQPPKRMKYENVIKRHAEPMEIGNSEVLYCTNQMASLTVEDRHQPGVECIYMPPLHLASVSASLTSAQKLWELNPTNQLLIESDKFCKTWDYSKVLYWMNRVLEQGTRRNEHKILKPQNTPRLTRLPEACLIANEVINTGPTNADAVHDLGQCLYREHNSERAFQSFQYFLKQASDTYDTACVCREALIGRIKMDDVGAFNGGGYQEKAYNMKTRVLLNTTNRLADPRQLHFKCTTASPRVKKLYRIFGNSSTTIHRPD